MARGDDGDGAMHTYTTHNAHTLDSHICSHPHTHTSMHACMHALPSPPHSYATLYTHPPHTRTAPHNTHYTYIYHLLYNRTPTHIATHPTPNTLQHYTRNYVPQPARATAITTRPETRDSTDTHHADRDHDDDDDV